MKIKFESIEIIDYLDEFFIANPWLIICDSYRRQLYVGFPYHIPDSSIEFIVISHTEFDSHIGSEAFDLDVSRFLDSVRKEFPDA